MNIIKEICNNRAVIRTNTYGRTLCHILMLFEEAKKDFEDLTPDNIQVVVFGGRHYAGTYGIEFDVPPYAEAPKEYSEIRVLEFIK